MDKIKLQEYFEKQSHDGQYVYPYLYDEITQQILLDLSILEKRAKEEYQKDMKQKEEMQRHRLIKEWSAKYPKKYLFYEGNGYLIIKEDDEGQTIAEWIVNNYPYPNVIKINEIYYYENYKKLNGKIWYGSRYITIGKEHYNRSKEVLGLVMVVEVGIPYELRIGTPRGINFSWFGSYN